MDVDGTRLSHVAAGTLRAKADDPLARRLAVIAGALEGVLDEWRPETAAVEDVFVKLDPRAALAIGHGRGALLAVLGRRELVVHSYAPASIKRTLTGSGRATKDRVSKMVVTLLGLSEPPASADAADALAVAVAHAFARKTQVLADT